MAAKLRLSPGHAPKMPPRMSRTVSAPGPIAPVRRAANASIHPHRNLGAFLHPKKRR